MTMTRHHPSASGPASAWPPDLPAGWDAPGGIPPGQPAELQLVAGQPDALPSAIGLDGIEFVPDERVEGGLRQVWWFGPPTWAEAEGEPVTPIIIPVFAGPDVPAPPDAFQPDGRMALLRWDVVLAGLDLPVEVDVLPACDADDCRRRGGWADAPAAWRAAVAAVRVWAGPDAGRRAAMNSYWDAMFVACAAHAAPADADADAKAARRSEDYWAANLPAR